MVNVEGYEVPDELYYTEQHTWARIEGDVATFGITPIGLAIAGNVSFIRARKVGMKVQQGKLFGTMEAGKGVLKMPAPLSGEILEVNPPVLERKLDVVNNDPYGDGWLVKVKVADPGEKDNLIHGDKLEPWARAEVEKLPK
ncbi:MAG: glycine cleavage system protein H [Promethearchaeota archaeon]